MNKVIRSITGTVLGLLLALTTGAPAIADECRPFNRRRHHQGPVQGGTRIQQRGQTQRPR